MKSFILYLLFSLVLLSSCASGYKSVIEEDYSAHAKSDSIENIVIEYNYNVLNTKYSKKEYKKGVKLLKVKISNLSNQDLVFNEDIKLINETGDTLNLYTPIEISTQLKQNSGSYILYLLLTPLKFFLNINGQNVIDYDIGDYVGPILSALNIAISIDANNKFLKELKALDLNQKLIPKGSQVTGIIAFKAFVRDDLKLILVVDNN